MNDGNGRPRGRDVVSDPRSCNCTWRTVHSPLAFPVEVAHTLPLLPFVASAMNQAGSRPAGPVVPITGFPWAFGPGCWKGRSLPLGTLSGGDSAGQLGL